MSRAITIVMVVSAVAAVGCDGERSNGRGDADTPTLDASPADDSGSDAGVDGSAPDFTFVWGNPRPAGGSVFDFAVQDDSVMWAATGCGYVLESRTGGESWQVSRQPSVFCVDLYGITRSLAGTLVAVGEAGLVAISRDAGQTWQKQSAPRSETLFSIVSLPDASLVAVGSGGAVFRSTDDGATWMDRSLGNAGDAWHQVWLSAQDGYVVGDDVAHRTLDGGLTWERFLDVPQMLNQVFFVDSQTGWVESDFAMWRTTDGGDTWNEITPVSMFPLYGMRTVVLDAQHWLTASHGEGAQLWRTQDGGFDYELLPLVEYERMLGFPSLALTPGGRLLVGSSSGEIYTSDDLALSLTPRLGSHYPLQAMTVLGRRGDGQLLAAVQHFETPTQPVARLLLSTDEGHNWIVSPADTGLYAINHIRFFDAQQGLLAGLPGAVYTNDGGETWQPSAGIPAEMTPRHSSFASASHLFVVGARTSSDAGLFQSTDGGQSFSTVAGPWQTDLAHPHRVRFVNATTGYLLTIADGALSPIYKTTDAGQSWRETTAVGGVQFRSMAWFDTDTGLASAFRQEDSGVYRSEDGGDSWTRIADVDCRGALAFGSPQEGACLGPDANFLVTTDGGYGWTDVTTPLDSVDLSFSFGATATIPTTHGWLLGGEEGRLLVAE